VQDVRPTQRFLQRLKIASRREGTRPPADQQVWFLFPRLDVGVPNAWVWWKLKIMHDYPVPPKAVVFGVPLVELCKTTENSRKRHLSRSPDAEIIEYLVDFC